MFGAIGGDSSGIASTVASAAIETCIVAPAV
jgi:hypothetical protein